MTRMKEHIGFRCSKCQEVFRGLDSFHGEYRISCNNVKSIQLCRKCLYEIQALCQGELRNLRGQIEREIEICQIEVQMQKESPLMPKYYSTWDRILRTKVGKLDSS